MKTRKVVNAFAVLFLIAGRAAAEVKAPASLGRAESALQNYHQALGAGSTEGLHERALGGQFTFTDEESVPAVHGTAPSQGPRTVAVGQYGTATLPAKGKDRYAEAAVEHDAAGRMHMDRAGYGAVALGAGAGVGALVGLAFANPLLGALIGLAVGAFFAYGIMTAAD